MTGRVRSAEAGYGGSLQRHCLTERATWRLIASRWPDEFSGDKVRYCNQ
jgi:hypothetical protein